jgi:transmembrane sensor
MTELHRHSTTHTRRRITEQAAAWYLDMHDEPNDAQRAEFLAWLRHSPAHVSEYLTMAQMHGDMPDVAALDPLDAQQLCALAATESPVIPLRGVSVATPNTPRATPRQHRFPLGWTAMAASVAALFAVVFFVSRAKPDLPPAVVYANTASETHSEMLPDGSLVELGQDSAIAVRYGARRRDIELLRGNVVFDVGKDPVRPLQVQVGDDTLRDIGTVFAVRQDGSDHSVTVMSGRVDLLAPATLWQVTWSRLLNHDPVNGKMLADLSRGEQAVFDAHGKVLRLVAQADVTQATAWLPPDIGFQDSPISDVARRFNAYTTRPIVIDDPAIANTRISGLFHANDPDSFLAYLAAVHGVSVERGTDSVHVRGPRTL